MPSAPPAERRKHPRHTLNTGLHFLHEPSRRRLPGRCENISRGGLKMYVPAGTPVKAGDSIQVSLSAPGRPEFSALGDKPLNASVVRVERQALLSTGHLAVGVRFMGG